MLILIDPRRSLAVHPGDISSMQIMRTAEGEYLQLSMASGKEIKVWADHGQRDSALNLKDVHQRLMEACK